MFKKLYTLIGSLGAISTAFYPGFAYSTCKFAEQTNLEYQHNIQSIEDYQKHTTDYAKGARQCTVSFRVKVDDEWYVATGDYVYGSRLSDDNGCSIAEERAKEDILRLVSPEVVTGSKDLVCRINNITEKDPTVDLFTEITDNKDCKRIYHEVMMDSSLGQVWECADE